MNEDFGTIVGIDGEEVPERWDDPLETIDILSGAMTHKSAHPLVLDYQYARYDDRCAMHRVRRFGPSPKARRMRPVTRRSPKLVPGPR